MSGPVTCGLEKFGHCCFIAIQVVAAVYGGADVCSVGHAAGKQGSASGSTEGVNVKIGESRAFRVESIEVGCFYDWIAMAGQVAITLIVCHN